MRTAARTDANQRTLVGQLREMGVSVTSLHRLGGGVPDLLLGYEGRNYLFELKSPDQPPSGRVLTPAQVMWRCGWRGQVAVATTLQDILEELGLA